MGLHDINDPLKSRFIVETTSIFFLEIYYLLRENCSTSFKISSLTIDLQTEGGPFVSHPRPPTQSSVTHVNVFYCPFLKIR